LCIFRIEALMTRVQVLNETSWTESAQTGATLWFQWCRYLYDDGQVQYGYRFTWKRALSESREQQPTSGQARIPSIDIHERLVRQARSEGWGDYDDQRISSSMEAHWAQGPAPKAE
jgi:hypothetical protein